MSLLYLTKRDREEEERVLKDFWNNLKKICNSKSLRNANGTYKKEKQLLSFDLSGDWNGILGVCFIYCLCLFFTFFLYGLLLIYNQF